MAACPNCGQQVREGDAFCRACGHALNSIRSKPRAPVRTILVAIALVVGSGAFLWLLVQLRHILFELLLAAFIALVLSPAVALLQRRGVGRGRAIAVTVIVFGLAVAGIGAAIAAPLSARAVNFAQHAPKYLNDAAAGKGALGKLAKRFRFQNRLKQWSKGLSGTLSRLSKQLITLGRRIASAAFEAAIVTILAIFMLVEGPRLLESALLAIPPPQRAPAARIGNGISKVVARYMLGVLAMAALNGLVAAVAMIATGTPFAVPLALWAGVVDILPIVGGLLAIIPAGLFAFSHSVLAGIVVVAAILVYQQIKNHILYPILVGRAVNLNSLLVLVAVLAGAQLGHVAGAILAIPVAGSAQVIGTEIVGVWRERRLAAKPAEVTATPIPAPEPVRARKR